MSGDWNYRYPFDQHGRFATPRIFPPVQSRSEFSRPRFPVEPRGACRGSYRGDRGNRWIHGSSNFRGRHRVGQERNGNARFCDQGSNIEIYYKHSMVEDPWKELEEK